MTNETRTVDPYTLCAVWF